MSDSQTSKHYERRYSSGALVRRLLGLAWQFRGDCLRSLAQSLMLLLLGLAGLQLLGLVIDVIRHALDPAAVYSAILMPRPLALQGQKESPRSLRGFR